MIRTIIAINDGELEKTVTNAFSNRGIQVRYHCHSGAEVIRAVKQMGGGVVICPFKLSDMTVNDLASALGNDALLLTLAKGKELSLIDRDEVFKLPVPVRLSELLGAVTMLMQMDDMRAAQLIPKRSKKSQDHVDEAKRLLMQHYDMTEPEAHRYLQTNSMKQGARMSDTAFFIIQKLKKESNE